MSDERREGDRGYRGQNGWDRPADPEHARPAPEHPAPHEPAPDQRAREHPAAAEPGAEQPSPGTGQPASVPRPPGDVSTTDPNLVAIQRANLPDELAQWLHEVAAQVDPRLDRVAPDWRNRDQAEAARACVFGLLIGYLGRTYPHVRGELAQVAESHPSFSTLESGSRLATLEQIVADFNRVNAWLGPLVDVDDPRRMRAIVE